MFLFFQTRIYLISFKVFNKWILPKVSGFAAILSYSSTSYFITILWTSLVTSATSFLTSLYIYIYKVFIYDAFIYI